MAGQLLLHNSGGCRNHDQYTTCTCILLTLAFAAAALLIIPGDAGTLTVVNNCEYTVWPGVLSNAGSQLLAGGGFILPAGQSATLDAPPGWSGRLWGRTVCSFDGKSSPACQTGDCGSSTSAQCNGAGAATPATLAEFTFAGAQGQDFYDVSLVDGYNLPIAIVPATAAATANDSDSSSSNRSTVNVTVYSCGVAGCSSDLNLNCPSNLQLKVAAATSTTTDNTAAGSVVGCRSACDAFRSPEYCCSGAYSNPSTCQPSVYSRAFKAACPRAYSYAYDDPTSTFTCSATHDYSVIFCPTSLSQKTDGISTSLDSVDSSSSTSILYTSKYSLVYVVITIIIQTSTHFFIS